MNAALASDRLPEDRSTFEPTCDTTERTTPPCAEHSPVSSDTLPEHRLMIALLRDAIRCVEKYRNAREAHRRRLFEADSRWFLSDDASWICSFARVCETLGLDPGSVRIALEFVPADSSDKSARVKTPTSMLQ